MLREDSGESTEQSIALNYRIAKKQVRRCKLQHRMWLSPQTRSCATSQRCLTRFLPLLSSLAALIYLFFFFLPLFLAPSRCPPSCTQLLPRSLVILLRVLPLPLSPFELIEANNHRTVVGCVYCAVVSVSRARWLCVSHTTKTRIE